MGLLAFLIICIIALAGCAETPNTILIKKNLDLNVDSNYWQNIIAALQDRNYFDSNGTGSTDTNWLDADTNYVRYQGSIQNVNLGLHDLNARDGNFNKIVSPIPIPVYTYYDYTRGSAITKLYVQSSNTEADILQDPDLWIAYAGEITNTQMLSEFSVSDAVVINDPNGYLLEPYNWHGVLTAISLPTEIPTNYYSQIYVELLGYWESDRVFNFYIYNFNTASWQLIGSAHSATSIQNIYGTITSNISNYISPINNKVYLMSKNTVSTAGLDLHFYYDYTRLGVLPTKISITGDKWNGKLNVVGDLEIGGIFSPSTILPKNDLLYSNGNAVNRWLQSTSQTINAYNTFNLGSGAYNQAGRPFYVRLDTATDNLVYQIVDFQADFRNPGSSNDTPENMWSEINHWDNDFSDPYLFTNWQTKGTYDGAATSYGVEGTNQEFFQQINIETGKNWTHDIETNVFYNVKLSSLLWTNRDANISAYFDLTQLYITEPTILEGGTGVFTGTINKYGLISEVPIKINSNLIITGNVTINTGKLDYNFTGNRLQISNTGRNVSFTDSNTIFDKNVFVAKDLNVNGVYHGLIDWVYTLIGNTGTASCNSLDGAIIGYNYTCQTCRDTAGSTVACGTTLVTLNANCACRSD